MSHLSDLFDPTLDREEYLQSQFTCTYCGHDQPLSARADGTHICTSCQEELNAEAESIIEWARKEEARYSIEEKDDLPF